MTLKGKTAHIRTSYYTNSTSLIMHSAGFKLEDLVGHWPSGPPLLCWFHRPTSETSGRLQEGEGVKHTKCNKVCLN